MTPLDVASHSHSYAMMPRPMPNSTPKRFPVLENASSISYQYVRRPTVNLQPFFLCGRLCSDQEVSRRLESKPAAGHAGRNFEEIGHYALVETSKPFLGDNNPDGVPYGFVLIAHARHRVDLKTPTENVAVPRQQASRSMSLNANVQGICTGLSNGP